jgi:hypothetical protein
MRDVVFLWVVVIVALGAFGWWVFQHAPDGYSTPCPESRYGACWCAVEGG